MPNSTPPPLPTPSGRPNAVAPPTAEEQRPLSSKLRDLGLLPPLELKGEFALGAWWTGRIGGMLALAAVIFYAVYVNIQQTFHPLVMVGEIGLIGAAIFWFSLRLSTKNQDLGRVIGASGLGILQFTAWSTSGMGGMEHFQLFDNILGSCILQFVAAMGVVAIALWRQDKLFAQLAVIFAGLAVFFTLQNPVSAASIPDYVNVIGITMVAMIGIVILLRSSWGSVAWLGLLVSQLCLGYWQFHLGTETPSLPIQITALFCFATLWVGAHIQKDSDVLGGTRSHESFQLASFFIPAIIAFVACNPTDHGRSDLALLIAVIALGLGWLERVRSANVSQIMLISSLVFAAAGLTTRFTDNRWIVWLLAAALAQLMATKMKSLLGRAATEGLTVLSAYYLLTSHSSDITAATVAASGYPWASLVAIAGMTVLISFREDWECVDEWQYLLRIFGIVTLSVSVLGVQLNQSTDETAGWPWLVVGIIAFVRYRKGLIWAATPAYLYSCLCALKWMSSTPVAATAGWQAFWLMLIGLTQAGMIWQTAERKEQWMIALQHAFTFTMAFLMTWAAWFLGVWNHENGWSSQLAVWLGGAALITSVTAWLELSKFQSKKLVLALPGLLAAYLYILALFSDSKIFIMPAGLIGAALSLLGLGLLLRILARYTQEYADKNGESMQRAVLGLGILLHTFWLASRMTEFSVLPSIVWALASILIFVLGYQQRSKSFRMLGLAGLACTTCRMFYHDVTETTSRVIAVGIIAIAFLGVAWLYGRMNTEKQGTIS